MAVQSNLKIFERARLKKTRGISPPGEILVKPGDSVSPETVIARTDYMRGSPYIVDLRAEFKDILEPDFLDQVLVKKAGDRVKRHEVIARYWRGSPPEPAEVTSPCDGTIEYISRMQAKVVIREDPDTAQPVTIIPVSAKLGINPRWLRMYTVVKEGDFVREGQVVAGVPGGGKTDFVYAPVSGIVDRICPRSGGIILIRPIMTTRILAQMAGRVTAVRSGRSVTIEAEGAYIEGVFGTGGEQFGPLEILASNPQDSLDEAAIDESVRGRVVLAGAFASYGAIQKARALGARAIVAGGFNHKDMERAVIEPPENDYAGPEDDFTLVALEGFGKTPLNERTWHILNRRKGKVVTVFGGSWAFDQGLSFELPQDARPHLMISEGLPQDLSEDVSQQVIDPADAMPVADPSREPRNLGLFRSAKALPGNRVRCIRGPHAGLWGMVEREAGPSEKAECEAVLDFAWVRLDDGRLVRVAEANLEVFM